MKPRILPILLCLAALVLLAAHSAHAEDLQTINIDQTATVDAIGNASMQIKFRLSALQFGNWQAKYGENTSLLRRDVGKNLSQYDTTDWDVDEKKMDREVIVSLKMKGLMKYRGDGQFEYKIPKQWLGDDRNNNVLNFHFIESLGPGLVSQNSIKVIFPENATNFQNDTSEEGDKVVKYTLPTATAGGSSLLWLGIVMMLAGLGVAASALLARPSTVPMIIHVSHAQQRPAIITPVQDPSQLPPPPTDHPPQV